MKAFKEDFTEGILIMCAIIFSVVFFTLNILAGVWL